MSAFLGLLLALRRRRGAGLLLLAGALALPTAGRAQPKVKLAVLALRNGPGVTPQTAEVITETLTAAIQQQPGFQVLSTKDIENGHTVRRALARVRGQRHVTQAGGAAEAATGSQLPVLGNAPEIQGTQHWFNTPGDRPLTLAGAPC